MLSGGGGGFNALEEEELSDSSNSDDSDRPACSLIFDNDFLMSCFYTQVNPLKKQEHAVPPPRLLSSPALMTPGLFIVSLSQSDVAIDPTTDHLRSQREETHPSHKLLSLLLIKSRTQVD